MPLVVAKSALIWGAFAPSASSNSYPPRGEQLQLVWPARAAWAHRDADWEALQGLSISHLTFSPPKIPCKPDRCSSGKPLVFALNHEFFVVQGHLFVQGMSYEQFEAEQERELKRWKAELQKIEGLRSTVAGEADEEESVFDQALPLYQELCEQRYIRKPKVKAAARANQEETEEQKWRRKYGKDVDRFVSPNGHEVLAGRSASANERVSFELTFKDALWFHTDNGIPGSHVTIRAPVGEVGDEDIEFAAAVAAWHSKAREKLYAPVMYCQGYQLRKPARRRTGQVQVSGNYQQIDVRPALPDS
ncbi:rqcH [Symbiodinium natans]|uniref:RqcH protein n=1 Tax=Symbiodinium natans TaxID=878477 RepID=A0A812SFF2_9DINO|nr:rqcH [Symbiodinium natans]